MYKTAQRYISIYSRSKKVKTDNPYTCLIARQARIYTRYRVSKIGIECLKDASESFKDRNPPFFQTFLVRCVPLESIDSTHKHRWSITRFPTLLANAFVSYICPRVRARVPLYNRLGAQVAAPPRALQRGRFLLFLPFLDYALLLPSRAAWIYIYI